MQCEECVYYDVSSIQVEREVCTRWTVYADPTGLPFARVMEQNCLQQVMVLIMLTPPFITAVKLGDGVLLTGKLKDFREYGGVPLKVILTLDAESFFKSITSCDLKTPAEKTLLGH
eukprot:6650191-Karenia_brevis.AAC.1